LKKDGKGKLGDLSSFDSLETNKTKIKKREQALKGRADSAHKGDIMFPIEPTYAVLKNREWIQGEEDNDWNNNFNKLLEDVSDDTLLTIVDCHT
jgi:hypothetical protein